eukprot:14226-Eustigmatos_ZCMA.PRE.1
MFDLDLYADPARNWLLVRVWMKPGRAHHDHQLRFFFRPESAVSSCLISVVHTEVLPRTITGLDS